MVVSRLQCLGKHHLRILSGGDCTVLCVVLFQSFTELLQSQRPEIASSNRHTDFHGTGDATLPVYVYEILIYSLSVSSTLDFQPESVH